MEIGRVAASASIVVVASLVCYFACQRASTIYFFELDSSRVLFISKRHAFAFPLILSVLLAAVYAATRRTRKMEEEAAAEEAEKQRLLLSDRKASNAFDWSSSASRKVSKSGELRPIAETTPHGSSTELQAERLLRMLSDIEEHDGGASEEDRRGEDVQSRTSSEEKLSRQTSHESTESPRPLGDEKGEPAEADDEAVPTRGINMVSRVGSEPPDASSFLEPLTSALSASTPSSRKSSLGSRPGSATAGSVSHGGLLLPSRISRGSSLSEDERPERACDLYKDLGQIDLFTYIVNAVNVFPTFGDGGVAKRNMRLGDLLSELIAVHVPVWACVAALHVVILEIITVKFAFYFYYHEETMAYSALVASISFGLFHEFYGGWMSNDILAFSSIYVIVSRVQLVSFQTGVVLSLGLVIFDLFWMYVIDLLSTVTGQTTAPLMVVVPRDNEGGTQRLATLDVMAPGVLLNLLLKYCSMYDQRMYNPCFYSMVGGLSATLLIAIYRNKVTPALVLPLLGVLGCSLSLADRPFDLWRFMIKH